MTRRLTSLAFVFAAFMAVSSVHAQSDAQASANADRKAQQQAMRQQLMLKIEQVKHEKLVKALGLDEQTAPKFFELYKPAEQDIQSLVRQRNEEMKKLQDMMKGAKSDADVDPEMQKIRDLNGQIETREQKLDSDLKSVLSPRQRARLLVFEHEFNQKIRSEIAKRQVANAEERKQLRQQLREEHQKMMQKKRGGR
jgi:hypothetical protein